MLWYLSLIHRFIICTRGKIPIRTEDDYRLPILLILVEEMEEWRRSNPLHCPHWQLYSDFISCCKQFHALSLTAIQLGTHVVPRIITQDLIENLFSVLRLMEGADAVLTAKLIESRLSKISLMSSTVKATSNHYDSSGDLDPMLSVFLSKNNNKKEANPTLESFEDPGIFNTGLKWRKCEVRTLTHISGWILRRIFICFPRQKEDLKHLQDLRSPHSPLTQATSSFIDFIIFVAREFYSYCHMINFKKFKAWFPLVIIETLQKKLHHLKEESRIQQQWRSLFYEPPRYIIDISILKFLLEKLSFCLLNDWLKLNGLIGGLKHSNQSFRDSLNNAIPVQHQNLYFPNPFGQDQDGEIDIDSSDQDEDSDLSNYSDAPDAASTDEDYMITDAPKEKIEVSSTTFDPTSKIGTRSSQTSKVLDDSCTDMYQVGEKVEVIFNLEDGSQEWFPGEIVALNPNNPRHVDVEFMDGQNRGWYPCPSLNNNLAK